MIIKLFWFLLFILSIAILFQLIIIDRNIYCDVYVNGYRYYGQKASAIKTYYALKSYLHSKPYLNYTNKELEQYKINYYFPNNYTEYLICKRGNWLNNTK